jgi:hypothetical protein
VQVGAAMTAPDVAGSQAAAMPGAVRRTAGGFRPAGLTGLAGGTGDADYGGGRAGPGDPASDLGAEPMSEADVASPTPAALGGALPQDASLEPGGGECGGGAVPAAAEPAGGAGCGAGGGGAPAEPAAAEPATPDVSAQPPEVGLATTAQLPPHQMRAALDGVDGSVARTVGEQRSAVEESPPSMDRPAGAPHTLHGALEVSAPGEYTGEKVDRAQAAKRGRAPEVSGGQVPGGTNPADEVKAPGFFDTAGRIIGAIVGAVIPIDRLTGALDDLPTRDPALNTTVGTAERVPLKDDTDPGLTDRQRANLDNKNAELKAAGREDSAREMGERQIFPDVPAETLRAQVPASGRPRPGVAVGPGATGSGGAGPGIAGAGTAGRGAGPGGVPPSAISAVTQQERDPGRVWSGPRPDARRTADQGQRVS